MRRYSVWVLLAVSITILSYITENEVMAAPAPDPCFFFPFPHKHRRPKKNDDDQDKEKKGLIAKASDTLRKDFDALKMLLT